MGTSACVRMRTSTPARRTRAPLPDAARGVPGRAGTRPSPERTATSHAQPGEAWPQRHTDPHAERAADDRTTPGREPVPPNLTTVCGGVRIPACGPARTAYATSARPGAFGRNGHAAMAWRRTTAHTGRRKSSAPRGALGFLLTPTHRRTGVPRNLCVPGTFTPIRGAL